MQAVTDRREAALALLANYLPSVTGDARFKEIAKDYGGMGTTCGYLPIWMWWRLGCIDARLINREQPELGLHYKVAQNIAAIVRGGKAAGAWRTLKEHGRPKPGDTVYYAKDPPELTPNPDGGEPIKNFREHVNVAVDCSGSTWRTGDAGRTSGAGTQMAEFVSRAFHESSGTVDYFGGPRRVVGWVDLDAVALGPPPYDVSIGGLPPPPGTTPPPSTGEPSPPSSGRRSSGALCLLALLALLAVGARMK